jgi:hypothetical protein
LYIQASNKTIKIKDKLSIIHSPKISGSDVFNKTIMFFDIEI